MAHGDHTPLSKDKGKNLEARLFDHISTAVQLPFLDDIDERRIKRCVIALIVHSMMTDIPLQSVVEPENAKPIVVDILTKGIVNVFFEAEEKARLIEKLSQNVKNVPFVPIGIINLALVRPLFFWSHSLPQTGLPITLMFKNMLYLLPSLPLDRSTALA